MNDARTQEPLSGSTRTGGEPDKRPTSTPTRYRILWGAVPDLEADPDARPRYREILNPEEPGGWYTATSPETARRHAFVDESTEEYSAIQKALRSHGVILRHVPAQSWGEDLRKPLKVETREELTGSL